MANGAKAARPAKTNDRVNAEDACMNKSPIKNAPVSLTYLARSI